MNKKAIFIPLFALFTAILIVVLSLLFVNNLTKSQKTFIGTPAVTVINSFEDGNKASLYIKQAAGLSIWRSIEDSANDLTSFKQTFENSFNDNLNQYIKNYKDVALPLDNYKLAITYTDTIDIKGEPKQSIVVHKSSQNTEVDYKLSPEFTVQARFDINSYLNLLTKIQACTNADNVDPCLETLKAENVFTYKKDKNLISIEIPTINNSYTNKIIILKANIKINPLL